MHWFGFVSQVITEMREELDKAGVFDKVLEVLGPSAVCVAAEVAREVKTDGRRCGRL